MATRALDHVVKYVRRSAEAAEFQPLSDRQLLERYRSRRDETAFAALVRRHSQLVLSACRQVLSEPADIDDAFQATFLVLVRSVSVVRWRDSIGNWLFGVAHRVAVRARIGARQRQARERRAGQTKRESNLSRDLSWRDAVGVLHEELDELPDKFRLPLLLCYLHGQSRDEAAAHLGLSVSTIKGRLEIGRTKLRRRLARRKIELSAGLLSVLAAEIGGAAAVPLIRATTQLADGVAPSATVAALASGTALLTASHSAKLAVGLLLVAGLSGAWVATPRGSPAEQPPIGSPPPAARRAAAKPPNPDDSASVVIHGRVLGPDGNSIAGARLFTYRAADKRALADGDSKLVEAGRSGPDGRFQIDAPRSSVEPRDVLPVVAAADRYGSVTVRLAAPPDELTIRLLPEQPIKGRILDINGRPVAGAIIRVEAVWDTAGQLDIFLNAWKASWHDAYLWHGGISQPPASVMRASATDRDGRFSIDGAGAECVVHVEVRAPGIALSNLYVVTRAGFNPGPINQAVAERESPDLRSQIPILYSPSIDFVAAPSKEIEGVLRESGSGRPIPGARVMSTVSYSSSVITATDAAGHYRLPGIPKRKDYSLNFYPPDGSPLIGRSVTISDTPGLEALVNEVNLMRGVIVSGRLIDQETGRGVFGDLKFIPVPGNPFVEKPEYAAYRENTFGTSTKPDGHFILKAIPGPGVLVVQAHGQERLDDQPVTPYTLADLSEEDRKRMHITKQQDGRLIVSTAGGSNQLIMGASVIQSLNLVEGAEPAQLDVHLDRGRTVVIRVQDADGRPLAGATVAGMTAVWPTTFLLPQAECTVYGLSPKAERTVVFYHPEQKLSAALKLRGDVKQPLTVNLTSTGAIKGRLTDADGKPIADARIIVVYWDNSARELDRYLKQRYSQVQTDMDGRFELSGLVAGMKLDLGFSKGPKHLATLEGKPWFSPYEVKSGQTLDVGELRTKPFQP